MKAHILLSILSLILIGCANPINDRTSSIYNDAARQAENAGDLENARMYYSRAYANTLMGNLGPRSEAFALYEYSRLNGYLCDTEKSKKGFEDVIKLIEENPQKIDDLLAPALAEYSRLLHDTGDHTNAVVIYSRAVNELEKLNVLDSDPITYANFLEEYATSLKSIGNSAKAREVKELASSIRTKYPDSSPNFSPRRYCP